MNLILRHRAAALGMLALVGCRGSNGPGGRSSADDDPGPVLTLDSQSVADRRGFLSTVDSSLRIGRSTGDSEAIVKAQAGRFAEVAYAQQELARLGYGTAITGELDGATRDAIRRFERRHQLPGTGDPHSPTFQVALGMVSDSTRPDGSAGAPMYRFTMGPRDSAFAEGVWIRRKGGLWDAQGVPARIVCRSGQCVETFHAPGQGFDNATYFQILDATPETLTAKGDYPCASRLLRFRRSDSSVTEEVGNVGDAAKCKSPWATQDPPLRLIAGDRVRQMEQERTLRWMLIPRALFERVRADSALLARIGRSRDSAKAARGH